MGTFLTQLSSQDLWYQYQQMSKSQLILPDSCSAAMPSRDLPQRAPRSLPQHLNIASMIMSRIRALRHVGDEKPTVEPRCVRTELDALFFNNEDGDFVVHPEVAQKGDYVIVFYLDDEGMPVVSRGLRYITHAIVAKVGSESDKPGDVSAIYEHVRGDLMCPDFYLGVQPARVCVIVAKEQPRGVCKGDGSNYYSGQMFEEGTYDAFDAMAKRVAEGLPELDERLVRNLVQSMYSGSSLENLFDGPSRGQKAVGILTRAIDELVRTARARYIINIDP